jgi:hypothetical protein
MIFCSGIGGKGTLSIDSFLCIHILNSITCRHQAKLSPIIMRVQKCLIKTSEIDSEGLNLIRYDAKTTFSGDFY